METIAIPGFSEPFSCISHLLAAGLALVGGFLLVRKARGNSTRVFAVSLYTFSLIFLFSMSGVYHMLQPGGAGREVLQRLDHAGIWVLIAGTFTPLHLILFRGFWRWGVLLFVWMTAITALVLEIVFFKEIYEVLKLSLYLGLGWVGTFSGIRFYRFYQDHSVRWLLAGGLLYTIGAIIDFAHWPIIWNGVIGSHELFHLFVIAASVCHWFFIYLWCDQPTSNKLVVQVQIFPGNRFRAETDNISLEAESLEQLKTRLARTFEKRFHASVFPIIHLKYSKEEIFTVSEQPAPGQNHC